MTDDQKVYAINEVLISYAPDESARSVVRKMFNDSSVTLKDYVMALSDGLRFGNWPWTNYKSTEQVGDALENFLKEEGV